MLVLVTYDVRTSDAGSAKRLRRVANACGDYGRRVQYSVFEVEVDPAQWTALRAKLEALIDRHTIVCATIISAQPGSAGSSHVGARPKLNLDGPLIV